MMERITELHVLKCARPWFAEVSSLAKPFEVRKDDRDFQIGDVVVLREVDERDFYTPHNLIFRIGYVLRGFPGLQRGYCAFGLIEPDAAALDIAEAAF